jgi:hypothetical protein
MFSGWKHKPELIVFIGCGIVFKVICFLLFLFKIKQLVLKFMGAADIHPDSICLYEQPLGQALMSFAKESWRCPANLLTKIWKYV